MTHSYDRPTEPNAACAHPETTHRHGTNACYTLDGCRCDDCRDASSRAWRDWIKQKAGIKPSTYIDAEPVRRRVLELMEAGMSLKRIGKLSGVPNGALGKLVYGIPSVGRPPSKKITRRTADRLLSCPYSVADGARVDATEARAIVDELLARGWTKAEIGRRVSGDPNRNQLQAVKPNVSQVTAGTLRALRHLLEEPVPQRLHAPTGKLYTPNTGHQWRHIRPTTPGVPAEGRTSSLIEAQAKRQLLCEVCGEPLVTHPITKRCA